MIRYGTLSFLHQLERLPEDRLHWQPDGAAHSAMEIAAEAISVFRLYQPLLEAQDAESVQWVHAPRVPPEDVSEARSLLIPAMEAYVHALEASGPELARQQPMPFGATFWAEDAATYPLLDLMHHHGQLCYLQALLGDEEQHWNDEAISRCFMR